MRTLPSASANYRNEWILRFCFCTCSGQMMCLLRPMIIVIIHLWETTCMDYSNCYNWIPHSYLHTTSSISYIQHLLLSCAVTTIELHENLLTLIATWGKSRYFCTCLEFSINQHTPLSRRAEKRAGRHRRFLQNCVRESLAVHITIQWCECLTKFTIVWQWSMQ